MSDLVATEKRKASARKLVSSLRLYIEGGSSYCACIELALEEAEERGRREENEAWKKAAGECKRSIGDILLAIRSRMEEK